jgi:hypothetical protein
MLRAPGLNQTSIATLIRLSGMTITAITSATSARPSGPEIFSRNRQRNEGIPA